MRTRVHDGRSGVAMLTVLGIIFALCLLMGTVLVASSQRTFTAKKLADRTRALAIAEAGATRAYTVLSTNFDLRTDPAAFPATAFGGGTYYVGIVPVGSNMAVINSTGVCGIAQESVVLNVKNYPLGGGGSSGSSIPGWPAFGYGFAVIAGGNLTWAGNTATETSNGWMHCNGLFNANGANTIYGNVSSSTSIGGVGGATITGEGSAPVITGCTIGQPIVTNVPLVTIPSIDFTPYYTCASVNTQVWSTSQYLSGNVTPAGGVMWVNGDITLGNGIYTGCFIATGNIILQTTGNGTIENRKVSAYPLLMSRDGTITVKQAKTWTFRGLIYCKTGSIDKQGNGDVSGRGTVMAAGDISKNGGWSGMLYEDSTPVPPSNGSSSPGTGSNSSNVLGVTAWQK